MTAYRSGVPLRRDRGFSEFNGAPPEVLALAKQNLAKLIPAGAGGGGGFLQCDENLTAADIRRMFASPIELVPAVEGKMAVIVGPVLFSCHPVAAYAGGGQTNVFYQTNNANASGNLSASNLNEAMDYLIAPPTAPVFGAYSSALAIKNAQGSFTGGNGFMRVAFAYMYV
jgi:hypothetical protein